MGRCEFFSKKVYLLCCLFGDGKLNFFFLALWGGLVDEVGMMI